MSVEEDAELKNLVAQTLENKGILPKIRAELRANVFLALEENPNTKETLLSNDELSTFVKFPIGTLILNLIREFLEFFELEFTLSVFDPETKYGKEYSSLTKDKMMRDLKLTDCKKKNPLLYEVIERVINGDELRVLNSDKNLGDNAQVDVSGSGDSGSLAPSPVGLNSTYVKNKCEDELNPISPIEREGKDEDESIKEELISNNLSESDSVAESKLIESPKNLGTTNGDFKDSASNSPSSVPNNPIEIDLLTFTPVKETKPKDKMKNNLLAAESETKISEKKDSLKSVLGDLPPLTPVKSDEKGDKINEIKAIIDKWPGMDNEDESSIGSKGSRDLLDDKSQLKSDRSDRSDRSPKTDRSPSQLKSDRSDFSMKTGDDFEEDISDLLNGHTSSDNQLTVDETISKTSCGADYLESL